MNPLMRAAAAATVATLALVRSSDGSSILATNPQLHPQQQQQSSAHTTNQMHRENTEFFGIGKQPRNFQEDDYLDDWVPWRDPVPTPPTADPTRAPVSAPPTPAPTVPPTPAPTAPPTRAPVTAPPTRSPVAETLPPVAVVQVETLPPVPVVETLPPVPVVETLPPVPVVETLPPVPVVETPAPVPVVETPAPVPVVAPVMVVAPVAIPDTTFDEESGVRETYCAVLPNIGNFVTEVLDIEYFLYLNTEGILGQDDIQDIVDSSIEPQLHEALVNIAMGCDNAAFVSANFAMVELSSSGKDLVGAPCSIDTADDASLSNATACYNVWGQIEATMWFAPRRQRQLQGSNTPFGDREAFNGFTEWMEEAFEVVSEDSLVSSDTGVVKASFQGFVNLNEFDGTNLELTQDLGVDQTAAFMGTAYSVEDGGFVNTAFGMAAVIGGAVVLFFVIVVVAIRRRKSRKAYLEHARCVDELALDSKDDLKDEADVVDDESLFQEDNPLPDDFKVKLESADHDYRWIGEDRNKPVFVATERNKEFHDHLVVLRRKKEQEVLARQYQSAFI